MWNVGLRGHYCTALWGFQKQAILTNVHELSEHCSQLDFYMLFTPLSLNHFTRIWAEINSEYRLLYVGYIPRRRLSPFQKLPPAISVPAYVLHVALWNLLWILSISHLANQSFSDVRPKVSEGSVATHTCGVHGWILDKNFAANLLENFTVKKSWKLVEN